MKQATAEHRLKFRLFPDLLFSHPGSVVLDAIKKLRPAPNGLRLDGQGITLRQHAGLAFHVELGVDLPFIAWALLKQQADQLTSPETWNSFINLRSI